MTTDLQPDPSGGGTRPDERLLRRATGLGGALIIGLGSILGTGVFVSLALAAQPAGEALPLAILLAGLLAGANGLSAAQLAAVMPVSGGSYEYGRRLLSPLAGFTAGWLFLCAKTASAAAAALGLAAYLGTLLGVGPLGVRWWPPLAVALITLAALAGLRRSQWLNSLLVGSTLLSLVLFVAGAASLPALPGAAMASAAAPAGIAQATALVFVAFTGYGRIATMGEEVLRPERTIPRAVLLTLAVALLLYLAVAWSALRLAGPVGLASSVAAAGAASAAAPKPPLARLLLEAGWPWGSWIVALGASLALAGVLLNLILGLSRVWLAMGRRGDMPTGLATLDAAGTSPRTAVLLSGGLAALLSLSGRLELTWGFSAFTVLGYYAITNLCVLRLEPHQRRFPVVLAWLGLISCLMLAFQVPAEAWRSGLVVLGLGLLWRWGYHGFRRGPTP
jgi:basic amino acid/polyamine antiporter, APA family